MHVETPAISPLLSSHFLKCSNVDKPRAAYFHVSLAVAHPDHPRIPRGRNTTQHLPCHANAENPSPPPAGTPHSRRLMSGARFAPRCATKIASMRQAIRGITSHTSRPTTIVRLPAMYYCTSPCHVFASSCRPCRAGALPGVLVRVRQVDLLAEGTESLRVSGDERQPDPVRCGEKKKRKKKKYLG